MFKDNKKDILFQIVQNLNEEDEKNYTDIKRKKQENIDLNSNEKIQDLHRQLEKSHKYLYPSTIGVTGEVVENKQIIWGNNVT